MSNDKYVLYDVYASSHHLDMFLKILVIYPVIMGSWYWGKGCHLYLLTSSWSMMTCNDLAFQTLVTYARLVFLVSEHTYIGHVCHLSKVPALLTKRGKGIHLCPDKSSLFQQLVELSPHTITTWLNPRYASKDIKEQIFYYFIYMYVATRICKWKRAISRYSFYCFIYMYSFIIMYIICIHFTISFICSYQDMQMKRGH